MKKKKNVNKKITQKGLLCAVVSTTIIIDSDHLYRGETREPTNRHLFHQGHDDRRSANCEVFKFNRLNSNNNDDY